MTKTGQTDYNGDYAELMSIAVDRTVQNSGAGKKMLNHLERILKETDIDRLSLTTDKNDNENTLAFYCKNGFRIMYEFVTYPDRNMYRLIKEL